LGAGERKEGGVRKRREIVVSLTGDRKKSGGDREEGKNVTRRKKNSDHLRRQEEEQKKKKIGGGEDWEMSVSSSAGDKSKKGRAKWGLERWVGISWLFLKEFASSRIELKCKSESAYCTFQCS